LLGMTRQNNTRANRAFEGRSRGKRTRR